MVRDGQRARSLALEWIEPETCRHGYLTPFATPRCVSENTVRRGFTPEVQI